MSEEVSLSSAFYACPSSSIRCTGLGPREKLGSEGLTSDWCAPPLSGASFGGGDEWPMTLLGDGLVVTVDGVSDPRNMGVMPNAARTE